MRIISRCEILNNSVIMIKKRFLNPKKNVKGDIQSMENIFSVAVQYQEKLGYIEYDAAAKKLTVELPDAAAKSAAEKFLSEKHEIRIPHETLRDFTTELVDPLADIPSFKLALTRLWENTDVHVDWSRPLEYVKAHPTLETTTKCN